MDDLAIGTRTRKKIEAVKNDLTEQLALHPAGPIELHATAVKKASSWKQPDQQIELLGYKLQPGNGYQGSVHVVPGCKRIDRFRQRLKARLDQADKASDLGEVGLAYWRRWFDGQVSWTKVPHHSELVSENITMSYIDDYVHGLTMGKNTAVNAPAELKES